MPTSKRALPLPRKSVRLKDVVQGVTQRGATYAAIAKTNFAALAHSIRSLISEDLGAGLHRFRTGTRALAVPYARDERETLALLFLPVLLVASVLAAYQSARTLHGYVAAIAMPEEEIGTATSREMSGAVPVAMPRSTLAEVTDRGTVTVVTARLPAVFAPQEEPKSSLAPPPLAEIATSKSLGPQTLQSAHPEIVIARPAPRPDAVGFDAETTLALLAPAGEMAPHLLPVSPAPIEALEADAGGNPIRPGICTIDAKPRLETASLPTSLSARNSEAFGLHLATAAQSQIGRFVIYDETYRSISYPMGDVHDLYGVCTDLVVRAYRALGIDLQALVHRARSGRGDASIDHRRTEVLRRFFAAHGENLPVTTFPEDYRPGDIVTYYRPQNQRTRAHIAIVSSVMAPSGRPMIIHNRGWGPQLEDALFVDEITGHYRYRGPTATGNASRGAPFVPASLSAAALSPVDRRY
ncbi:DUF1287 domain-containing protein [Hyphomicrobium sp. CS1GBMeth3]|uniref:DUF1287 domain-containing protein n=1 Tax=Hyphomicrobium sp. CS1GBMeth3 TaxID=1892845 RepID=UPI001AECEA4B|nr:DUF1287 domain-containing protein [Hyphomicrobium sp. CS1GBMeth3]